MQNYASHKNFINIHLPNKYSFTEWIFMTNVSHSLGDLFCTYYK